MINHAVYIGRLAALIIALALFAPALDARERPLSTAALEGLGEKIATLANQRDFDAINAMVDGEALTNRAMADIPLSQSQSHLLHAGMLSALEQRNIVRSLLAAPTMSSAEFRFIGVISPEGERPRPVIRVYLGEEGFNYVEFVAARDDNNDYVIEDIFVLSNGRPISETLRDGLILAGPNAGENIATILGEGAELNEDERSQSVTALRQAIDHFRARQFNFAYNQVNSLPDTYRNSLMISTVAMTLASTLGEDIYRRELERFADNFGHDPRFVFLLVDHYVFQQDYDKAMECINKLKQRYGEETALLEQEAGIYFFAGETAKAIAAARKAMAQEPGYEDIYWTLVSIYNDEKRYSEMTDMIDTLNQRFDLGLVKADFEADPYYNNFANSSEFKTWQP